MLMYLHMFKFIFTFNYILSYQELGLLLMKVYNIKSTRLPFDLSRLQILSLLCQNETPVWASLVYFRRSGRGRGLRLRSDSLHFHCKQCCLSTDNWRRSITFRYLLEPTSPARMRRRNVTCTMRLQLRLHSRISDKRKHSHR